MDIDEPTPPPNNDGSEEVATEKVPSSSTPQININETSSSKESTSDTTTMIANNNSTITISTPPRIAISTGKSSHTEPAPQIGIGWTQQIIQKRTPSGPYGKAERYYINPENTKKFKSMLEVCQYMNNSIVAGGGYVSVVYTPSGNSSSPGKVASCNNDGTPNISNATAGNDGGTNINLKVNTATATTTTSNNNSQNNSAINSASNSQSNSPRPPTQHVVATSGPGSGKSIDTHPFNKGSVIEVLYIKNKKQEDTTRSSLDRDKRASGDDFTNWDNDDESISDWFNSDDEEETTANNNTTAAATTTTTTTTTAAAGSSNNVYLADIIDRIPIFPTIDNLHPNQRFKYYIHYRNFNRRMDEWITQDRIVSPPSVGNQKVRQIKRKEERRKREEEEKRERERILNEAALGLGGGTRRASIDAGSSGIVPSSSTASLTGAVGGSATTSAAGRKRLRRTASSGIDSGSSFDESSDDPSSRSRRQSRSGGGVGVGATSPKKANHSTGSGALSIPQVSAINVVTTIEAQVLDEHEGMDEIALKEHEEVTKIKNVNTLELGKYQMDTWYYSPFPKEMFRDKDDVIDVLYVDEFSLNFFTRKEELLRYQKKALMLDGDDDGSGRKDRRHPPGNEIYRCGNLSMFEVDGFEERLYCQNLCYIAKLFLDHKTLYFDVDPFLFYVLCEVDERGYHPVGYYSKEKYSDVGYNLACILTFPSHQRKGYGRFLIAFSYELSKKEEKVGSPEKPMSDLGQQAYIPYWTSTIVDFLLNQSGDSKSMSIIDIAKKTSIMTEDVIFALNTLGILKFVNGVYFIYAEQGHLEDLVKKHPVKEPRVDPSKLHWTPYITDVKKDKYSIKSKAVSVEADLNVAK